MKVHGFDPRAKARQCRSPIRCYLQNRSGVIRGRLCIIALPSTSQVDEISEMGPGEHLNSHDRAIRYPYVRGQTHDTILDDASQDHRITSTSILAN